MRTEKTVKRQNYGNTKITTNIVAAQDHPAACASPNIEGVDTVSCETYVWGVKIGDAEHTVTIPIFDNATTYRVTINGVNYDSVGAGSDAAALAALKVLIDAASIAGVTTEVTLAPALVITEEFTVTLAVSTVGGAGTIGLAFAGVTTMDIQLYGGVGHSRATTGPSMSIEWFEIDGGDYTLPTADYPTRSVSNTADCSGYARMAVKIISMTGTPPNGSSTYEFAI